MGLQGYHGFLSGIVQGVGMRFSVKRAAETYGLRGYVRNLKDGRVEVYLEGEKEVVSKFKQILKENELGVGRIDHVEGDWIEPKPEQALHTFEIRR